MKRMKEERGFTLIELLMVIAIIGFLSSVVLIAVDQARIQARDSKRISDIRQIQNALEIYAADNNNLYPNVGGTTYVYALSSHLTPNYISVMAEDPTRTGSSRYRYATANQSSDRRSYTILVDMEGDGTGWCKVQMPLYAPGNGYVMWENTYSACQY